MIYGNCHTNLDAYQREEWTEEFVAVPRIGERVKAKSGKSLKVCSIAHTMLYDVRNNKLTIPGVLIELHH